MPVGPVLRRPFPVSLDSGHHHTMKGPLMPDTGYFGAVFGVLCTLVLANNRLLFIHYFINRCMKGRMLAAILTAAVAAAAWYGFAQNTESQEPRMRVAFFPNIAHAVPIVIVERGAFEGADTELDPRLFDSGPQVIEALFSGSIDMAYVGPGPAINGFLRSTNGDIRILAGAASGGSSFVIHPDSDITGPQDMVHKRVAAPQIGNSQDISLRTYIKDNGLATAESGGSITVLNIANPDTYTLFTKGEVDAAWVPEPWATILVRELDGARLFYEEELWEDGLFASVVLVAREEFVLENEAAIQSWLKAHHSTIRWINENPAETQEIFNRYIEAELGKPFPDHIVEESLDNLYFTGDPLTHTIDEFAARADSLGYLGRHGYSLDGLYMVMDSAGT